MVRTSCSLYSSELLYLDSGRKSVNYFEKGRSWWSMFERYLFPQTQSIFLKIIIWLEILTYLLLLFGLFGTLIFAVQRAFALNFSLLCTVLKMLPFIALFIVIALSGGYARMRLPIEPLMIILSFSFWIRLFKKQMKA